ncbi:MAG: hypothetical protein HY851_08100 [candidate division Zixibacteria bacterium]|nr:hypothetical protein [candidate division Zixibacteria bacterium]
MAGVAALVGLLGILTNNLSTIHIDFGGAESQRLDAVPDVRRIGLHFLATYLDLLLALTVLLAAGVIPNFLRPGISWLYFGRPLDRQAVIVNKVIATAALYSALMVAAALPATLAGMIRYGVFDLRIAQIILIQMFAAAIWLAIVSALGVFFRSAVKVIPICLGLIAIQVVIANRHMLSRLFDSSAIDWILNAVAWVTPGTNDLSDAAHCLAEGGSPALGWPIGSSLLFALVLIYSALQSVKRRDL